VRSSAPAGTATGKQHSVQHDIPILVVRLSLSQAMRRRNPFVLWIGTVRCVVKLNGDVRPANL
jgi:hypothetical protein